MVGTLTYGRETIRYEVRFLVTRQTLAIEVHPDSRVLVRAHDRAVEHQIFVVPVRGQRLEHPLPYSGMTPTAEAAIHRLPLAVALGQVAPVRTGPQNPQTSVHKQAVI